MSNKTNKIAVIGDGGWGTTLAVHLAKKDYDIKLWGPFPEYVRQVSKSRYNSKFLPEIRLASNIDINEDLDFVVSECEVIVFAIPSKYAVDILKKIKKIKVDLSKKIFVSVTKGIDTARLLRISEMVKRELGNIPLAVLSGPTIAGEVAKGIPSTAVVAAQNLTLARKVQTIFNSDTFRIYTNTDIIGTEIGGSIKNIIAIACGVCDGLSFGSNTKAAILTRGLAEMARLGKELGAKQKTFSGLTGLGDLVTTCFSLQSRNRHVGELLGKGQSIKEILGNMEMVAEGVETVKAVYKLSRKRNISLPITTEVYNIIYKDKKPLEAVSDLMKRKMKAE